MPQRFDEKRRGQEGGHAHMREPVWEEALKVTVSHPVGKTRPSTLSQPCGVCLRLFDAGIQVAEISVPSATIAVER